ncbi:MAG: undecaprenyl/decaprenyl-phosphate alpha-N-acetylglucosaminyl 1-phosphate transferase [Cyclobacteriaceae bacterium]|nr:undecaprenyl/decaprenyl-phosphate alpha-N-acetylglucosaminyl 1-phosphate transferase [Cyclobacteriaceae bacterium]
MAVNLAACVTAFLVSFLVLPVIIKYSHKKNLGDIPGRRKIHKKVTPSLGGIAIFLAFALASMFWMDFSQWDSVRFVLASLLIVFIIGVRDDLVPFRALHKLFGQIVAVIILLFSGIHISSLFGFLGINEVPPAVGYTLTAFTIIVVTNSFNLIDGLDGLAGSVGIIALLAFGVWFHLAGDFVFSLFGFSMAGGLLAFLVFNWEPSEIFMGDTGAMVIGMLLAVMAVHFMNVNNALPEWHPVRFSASIASAVAFIIVPISDTLRIIILRLSKGKSPFSPDKSHIHHAIMRLGITHSRTAMILAVVNASFILLSYSFRGLGDKIMLPAIIVAALVLSIILDRLILRKLASKTT